MWYFFSRWSSLAFQILVKKKHVVHKIPRDWVLLENFNNVNDEWLWGRSWRLSHLKTKKNRRNLWLELVAQSRQVQKQQEVESQRRFHFSLMDRHPGSSTRSWSTSGWILQCLKQKKRRPALKNRLVGNAELHKGHLNRESLRAADGVKYFRDTLRPHFIKGAQIVFLWRLYQFTRARRGHVEMVKWIGKCSLLLKRTQDSWHVADVRPERRAKNKPVSCWRSSRECWKTSNRWDGFGSERTSNPRKGGILHRWITTNVSFLLVVT